MRSFDGRPRCGPWLKSRSFYAKKCDPRSHSVQSRGDVDVVLGGSVDHFTRPEGLRRREPMCPVLKSGGGLKKNTELLYQLIDHEVIVIVIIIVLDNAFIVYCAHFKKISHLDLVDGECFGCLLHLINACNDFGKKEKYWISSA